MTTNNTTTTITVEIHKNETGYTATANGVKIGWVCNWFNNTFAAVMSFGIRTRRDLAMPELDNAEKTAHGFINVSNAVLWLGDMIKAYYSKFGINATIIITA